MKKLTLTAAVIAIALALLIIVPTVVVPAFAAETVTTYANVAFEDYATGRLTRAANQNVTAPSLATVEDMNGNRVIRLDTVPATASGTTREEFAVYNGKAYNVSDGVVVINETSYPVVDGTVNVGGTICKLSTDAREYECLMGGNNVDKNIVLPTLSASYQSADKIYLQADYYISADAKGSVQSQFLSFSSTETTYTAYLELWKLDLANGSLKSQHKRSALEVLKKNEWNTVSMVLDLDAAQAEFYVNNTHVLSDNVGTSSVAYAKNLVLNANKWIVAKLNKDSTGLAENYGGYICIDNAKIETYTASNIYTPDALTDANGNKLAYLEMETPEGALKKISYVSGGIFKPHGATVTPVYFDATAYRAILSPIKGASVRLSHAAGIRFGTQLDLDMMNDLLAMKAEGLISDVSIGTVIAPRSYVEAAGIFTMAGLDESLGFQGSKYLDVKGTVGHYYGRPEGVVLDEGYDTCFVGSISNVKLGNRTNDFSAVGYVKITLTSGENVYLYSYDYDASTIGDYSRSVKNIAIAALADGAVNWSEDERIILSSFSNGATALSLGSTSVIKNVQYTATEFYFRNAAGVYCRLTFEGANGWRFQANGSSYNGFDEMGAGQALAGYLGESTESKAELLEITKDSSRVIVRSPSTDTYVTLNYKSSFNMQFYSGANALISNVSSISLVDSSTHVSEKAVVLSGGLTSNEAVYGGGERFDTVNKRGTSFTLYTADGWNKTNTTYMAIPLFVTSRGAGMFVNRYEHMVADFGAESSNAWKILINNDLMDCYFYATGKISDALFGYTEISGHASLPEEWAQGELICRYSPDFKSFEDLPEYTVGVAIEEVPDYGNYFVKAKNSNSYVQISTIGLSNNRYDYTYLFEKNDGDKIVYYKKGDNYLKTGKWGNPMGYGVKTIVSNLINAGMKPTAVVIEAFRWESCSTRTSVYQELKTIIEWLEARDIKTMLYMGLASLSSGMQGYDESYQVYATVTNVTTGATEYVYNIPKTSGTGENPDVKTTDSQQYLDITNPKAVDWYMNEVWGTLIDLGIDGIKIDFCECMPDEGTDYTHQYYDENGAKKTRTINLKYDWYDPSVFDSNAIHHAYPTYFISLFYRSMVEQKLAKNIPDGFVVLSRGGGIGSQRNPYIWEGDQARTFERIEDQLICMINCGISGVPFITYDLAGYMYGGNSDSFDSVSVEMESRIFARAIEFTAFSPNIQSHGDVRHAYEMTEETQQIYVNYTDLHEKLIPYLQKYSKIACDTGMPIVRHMILQYQSDTNVYGLDTQYMFGDALLVSPIVADGQTEKEVYLPAGEWLNLLTGETVTGGRTVTVQAELSQIPVFMNKNCSDEDEALLAPVFNSRVWRAISGIQFAIGMDGAVDDPWGEDPF